MRGARVSLLCLAKMLRIIPAYAGSTCTDEQMKLCYEDHPRVCGEHQPVAASPYPAMGSSPRMRGALGPGAGIPIPPGIIPAYAGSTLAPMLGTDRDKDHPRVCGEHLW